MEQWEEAALSLAIDCVSVTLADSHEQLSRSLCVVSTSSDDDDDLEQNFSGRSHVFAVRKQFRTIHEGLLLLGECLKRCDIESTRISPQWLQQIYFDVMGLCCFVDHVGASEVAAAVLLQIFETRIVHLQPTARALVQLTLFRSFIALSLEGSELLKFLESAGHAGSLSRNSESYGWRRSAHVCLPLVSSLKALVTTHRLHLDDGCDVFDAFVDAVIARARVSPASSSGIDCLNLLHFITNDHVMTSRVQSRRSRILAVCFAALNTKSFNCQSAACLVTSNLVTKVYGMLFARKSEYEVRVGTLTPCDWNVFTSLSPESAPGVLIALFSILSLIRASDDELLALEPVHRCRSLALACCRSPVAKLRFTAARTLPSLVAPSTASALLTELNLAAEEAKHRQHWNHMHGLALASDALQALLI
jgi:hypothetical protein